MKTDANCVFCKIAAKQLPASIVYEDDFVLAFLDIKPLSKGHMLVIPKEHYVDIIDIPKELFAKMASIVQPISVAIKKYANADGISLITQNGKAAGQEVFHIHTHIIARFDGVKLGRFDETVIAERASLEEAAAGIKKHLKI
jgi:histidine triad (HIT) family protein